MHTPVGFGALVVKRRCRKSRIVMSEQADWGAAPHTVVSKILWSHDLQTLDRLRCQNVCQTWKSLLHERPSALERGDWSTNGHLFIRIDRSSTERQHVILQLEDDPLGRPAILVTATSDLVVVDHLQFTFKDGFAGCCRWLTLQAHLFWRIQLCGDADTWSLMREVIRALQVATPQTPPTIAITTPLGNIMTQGHRIEHVLTALEHRYTPSTMFHSYWLVQVLKS